MPSHPFLFTGKKSFFSVQKKKEKKHMHVDDEKAVEAVHMHDDHVAVIGKGGYSTIVTTTLPHAGRVAIKMPKDPDVAHAEIQNYKAIGRHVNVLPFLGAAGDRAVFTCMDCDLADFLESKQGALLTRKQLVTLALGAAQGLLHMHTAGYLHLDVKHGNFLVDKTTLACCLCDLGLSRPCGAPIHRSTGTPCHMAPEMCTPGLDGTYAVGFPADVWGFGLVLWSVFGGGDPGDTIHEVCTGDVWAPKDRGHMCRRLFLDARARSSPRILRPVEKWLVDACTKAAPWARLTMHQVVQVLQDMMSSDDCDLRFRLPPLVPVPPSVPSLTFVQDLQPIVAAVSTATATLLQPHHLAFLEVFSCASDETVCARTQEQCLQCLAPCLENLAHALELCGATVLGKHVAYTLIFFALYCKDFERLALAETMHAVRHSLSKEIVALQIFLLCFHVYIVGCRLWPMLKGAIV